MSERIRYLIFLLLVSGLAALGACSSAPNSNGTAQSEPIIKSDPPKPAMSDKGDAIATGGDVDFMNGAAAGGMAEVELGKLAGAKAQNAEVKAFAQKMVEDHSKAGEELKQLAAQKKVPLPPDVLPSHKEVMAKLSKLNGADFDKEYVKAMVADHEKDVATFESVSKTAADADVKAFAAKTLPTLKMHQQIIQGLAAKMGVKP